MLHEPLLAEESKQEKETILEELQKGYTLNNKVIRQAKVKISK
jgi:molecular chaperone GrpE (heat shock protein)